jgi:hypothetical protein
MKLHELDGAKLKARRARVHFTALERSVSRFLDNNPYSHAIVSKDELEGETKSVEVQQIIRTPVPDSWGLQIGDIATNLRAALDHIAWQLSITSGIPINSKSDRNHIIFPVLDEQNDWLFNRATKFMSQKGKQIIESFQPYKHSRPKTQLLSVLNRLVNQDKHRIISPTLHIREMKVSPIDTPITFHIRNEPIPGVSQYEVIPFSGFYLAFGIEGDDSIDGDDLTPYPITYLEGGLYTSRKVSLASSYRQASTLHQIYNPPWKIYIISSDMK